MHPAKLNKLWLVLGLIFVALGLYNLFAHQHLFSLLTVAIGALVVYTSVYNMGGWTAALYEIGLGKLTGLRYRGKTKRKQNPWR